ncbi:MAG: DUF1328 domain-containing protein [Clostridia bacterium]|nr:DUF1328 domain-containing protein [Clostridia bacterium]
MFKWAVVFFILAVISGIFGFGLIATVSFGIARILFYIFLVLFVLSLLFGKRLFRST